MIQSPARAGKSHGGGQGRLDSGVFPSNFTFTNVSVSPVDLFSMAKRYHHKRGKQKGKQIGPEGSFQPRYWKKTPCTCQRRPSIQQSMRVAILGYRRAEGNNHSNRIIFEKRETIPTHQQARISGRGADWNHLLTRPETTAD